MKGFAFALTAGLLVLWRLPMLFADEPSRLSYLVVFSGLLAASVLLTALTLPRAVSPPRSMAFWGACFLLLIQVSLVRAGLDGTAPWGSVVLELIQWTALSIVAYLLARYSQSRPLGFEWVRNALVCYVVFNTALALVGFNNPRAGAPAPAQMLAAMGVGLDRVLFPTAEGFNNFGIIAGAALVAIAASLRERVSTFPALVGIPAALFAMLATDSRAALGLSIAVSVIVAVVRREQLRRLALVAVILVPIAPFAIMQWSSPLDQSSMAQAISRGGTDFSTFNNRDQIWRGGLSTFQSGSALNSVIGYGAFGQTSSGASASYEEIFDRSVEFPTLHNSLFQYLIDTGVLGLVVFGGLLCTALWSLSRAAEAGTSGARTVFGVLLYLLVAGITEVTGTLYHPESLAVLILVTAAILALPRREQAVGVTVTSARRRRIMVA